MSPIGPVPPLATSHPVKPATDSTGRIEDSTSPGEDRGPAPKKLIIAIHGIGDQIRYETAQSVAFRFYDFYDLPPALPVGRFYGGTSGVAMMEPPGNPNLAFAEAYWADIPRELVEQRYTLEEAKKWARTIVARLNLRAWQTTGRRPMKTRQYQMIEAVLDELIDAVFVLENLTFLAERAGLYKFDLKKTLDAYLNDVQVVTEFGAYRDKIVARLHELITKIEEHSDDRKGAQLYIIGHSEGSVVAFRGLLDAMHKKREWAGRVRGLMTIGSPIETHQILWADLWPKRREGATTPNPKIVWWNYMDSGDPIGISTDAHTRLSRHRSPHAGAPMGAKRFGCCGVEPRP
jgi:pimeloyl-ACP methyl ester carboxylesterase